jgi:hypothetical protein
VKAGPSSSSHLHAEFIYSLFYLVYFFFLFLFFFLVVSYFFRGPASPW